MNVLMINGSPRLGSNRAITFGKEQYGLPERENFSGQILCGDGCHVGVPGVA